VPTTIPEFGRRDPGATYRLRPGSYGIIRDERRNVAIVATPVGIFLPGGGEDPAETPEQALIREAREECGFSVRVLRPIGVADEFVYSAVDQAFYRKRGTFFEAAVEPGPRVEPEPAHELRWVSVDDAFALLSLGSQRWALALAATPARA
jgi:8-oxo-dGTP diphosphatase